MNIPCVLANKACLPCNDDPIANLSAEAPDVDVFPGWNWYIGDPPLGVLYAQIGCKRICYSEVSQQEADDCALLQAQECTWGGWDPPTDPPRPPGPDGPPGFPTPGGNPPSDPRSPLRTFRNTEQSCTKECPDGQPFVQTVRAGTVGDLTQALADAKAHSLACKRANANKICFVNTPTSGCVSEGYEFQILVTGGTQFGLEHDGGYIWALIGELPPGLSLDGATGVISGTPVLDGSYNFEVDVFDAAGNFASHVFTVCIGDITTDSTLPNGNDGTAYSQALAFAPTDVSDETWTLVAGALPSGLTLSTAGVISGTPVEVGTFLFTIQASGTCFGAPITCLRTFTLEIGNCALTCVQSALITPPANEPPYFSTYASNVGLIFGGGGGAGNWVGSGQVAVLHVINPATLAIVNTVSYAVDEVPEAGVYDPITERVIIASTSNLGADTAIKVINPTTLLTEDTTVIGGSTGPHALALDTVNERVYIGMNVGAGFNSELYSFDLNTHAVALIATGNTTLGAVAYSPDDDYIFCALDSGTISIFEGATLTLVATLAVTGGNATSLAYCPTNRCLYAGLFPQSAVRVWELDTNAFTNTSVNFVVPGTGSDVQITVGTTTEMAVGRSVTIDGSIYTIVSVDSPTLVTVKNVDAPPATLVMAPALVNYLGITLVGSIALPEPPSACSYDGQFDRIVTGANAAQSIRFIDPALQAIACSVFLGTEVTQWNNLGNSGCQLFIPTNNFPAFPTIPTDNLYHVII